MRGQIGNAFEFAVVASARARQLLRGCPPKIDPAEAAATPARVAQQEVLAGLVRRVDAPLREGEALMAGHAGCAGVSTEREARWLTSPSA